MTIRANDDWNPQVRICATDFNISPKFQKHDQYEIYFPFLPYAC